MSNADYMRGFLDGAAAAFEKAYAEARRKQKACLCGNSEDDWHHDPNAHSKDCSGNRKGCRGHVFGTATQSLDSVYLLPFLGGEPL